MAKRSDVIRGVTKVLEAHAPLVTLLGHTVGATKQSTGARILGFSNRLNELPLPGIILAIEGGEGRAPARELLEWSLSAVLYGEDVYQLADVLDGAEEALLAYRMNAFDPQLGINKIAPGPHQGFLSEPPDQLLAVSLSIEVTFIR